MKSYGFNKEKDKWLKAKRKIGFAEIIKEIQDERVLSYIDHPNKKKFPNQKIILVKLINYVYAIPYVETKDEVFLKTIYPSRKYTKKYLKKL